MQREKSYKSLIFRLLIFVIFISNFMANAKNLKLTLYTKKRVNDNNIKPISIDTKNVNNEINKIKKENYLCSNRSADCTSYFIIHGFSSNSKTDWVRDIKDELFKKHKSTGLINVFAVNWAAGNPFSNYKKISLETVPASAKILTNITNSLIDMGFLQKNETTLFLHCIGHSLGAHLCGLFGKELNRTRNIIPRRITGLDPARPCMEKLDIKNRLYKGDAQFMDIIHSSNILGMSEPIGDIDFYPNGGKNQPDCKQLMVRNLSNLVDRICNGKNKDEAFSEMCNHGAHQFFLHSINSCEPTKFESINCDSDDFENKKCSQDSKNYMGLYTKVSYPSNSKHFLTTTGKLSFPKYCGKVCSFDNSFNGFCSESDKSKKCGDSKDQCNRYGKKIKCCINNLAKVSNIDLTFVIDITNTSTLNKELFAKSIEFMSGLIKEIDINLDSARIAVVVYSKSEVKTLTYLNDKIDEQKMLNLINSIKLDNNLEKQNLELRDILNECEQIYTLEKGMRDYSKGFGKQILLLSRNILKNDKNAMEVSKKLELKG